MQGCFASRVVGLLAMLGVLVGQDAVAGQPQGVAPSACANLAPPPSAGQPRPRPADPCEGLRVVLGAVEACIAEFPDDRNLQIHAARILQLEQRQRVETQVLTGLRQLRANPDAMRAQTIDPELLSRRIAMNEATLATLTADLDRERHEAAAAGYPQLATEGVARNVITNAAWRFIGAQAAPHLNSCTDPAGRQAALESFGGIMMMMSRGNSLQQQTIRRIMGDVVDSVE
jgi:hypothetical protein